LGGVLYKKGYRGMFGADFLWHPEKKRLFAIELNPRLVASLPAMTPMEINSDRPPLLACHLACFLGAAIDSREVGEQLSNAGQLIYRQPERIHFRNDMIIRSGTYKIENNNLIWHSPGYSIGKLRHNFCLIWQSSNCSESGEWIRVIFNRDNPIQVSSIYEEWLDMLLRFAKRQS